jgi:hypothetical protein
LNKSARSSKCISHQGRLDEVFADDERSDDDAAAELGKEVLVGVGDRLDQTVGSQALDQVRGPARCERVDALAQIASAEAEDRPLAAGEGEEQPVVGIEEQIEAVGKSLPT